ncbi:lipoxygenase homology domain-containing protein 1-like isoform X5 [Porites lutea]|uniref:lipoxygenase homology domain-containing protein 1-like isoform X5 n=1 Tax=Porites lutea TaxID=51062 RepID=UPI003CC5F2BE
MKYFSPFLLTIFLSIALFKEIICADYEVQVTTGNSLGAGTDAKVYIKIFGAKESTAERELEAIHKDPFERGKKDTFYLRNTADVGTITAIAIKRDESGWFPKWQLARQSVVRDQARDYQLAP